MDLDKEAIIEHYFAYGYTYKEITLCLSVIHGLKTSVRQLKRILKRLNLSRRINKDDIDTVVGFVAREITESGASLGYRAVYKRLQTHGVTTDRETVRIIMKHLDPRGVHLRQQRRLERRLYHVPGPNYLWHIDGWDKLKPFGFSIHGCIDGFSRKIIWLEVAASNKDPFLVCLFFANAVTSLEGVPYVIRADRGTENGNIEKMQQFLRSAHQDERANLQTTFMYGASTSNQRIEAWWSKFPQQGMAYWIHHFKELENAGIFDTSCVVNIQCARFCYMDIIREELHSIVMQWNAHHIRKSNNPLSAHGKPDILYSLPELFNCRDYLRQIEHGDLLMLTELLTGSVPDTIEPAFELFSIIMQEQNLQKPISVAEADRLFVLLLDKLDSY